MSPFQYLAPSTVPDAVAALAAADGDARALAGGMTLIPSMKHDLAAPGLLVDLGRIASLHGIKIEGGELVVGAMATHSEVARSELVRSRLPVVAQLAEGIGDAQVRHRGTIGGSLANNDPSADYPAACLGLEASIVTSRRTLTSAEFFRGLFSTALAADEIITSIRFKPPGRAAYAKFASQASRYAVVGVFVAQTGDEIRVAVTGAGQDGVFRVPALERALSNAFEEEALPAHGVADKELIADIHASASYRSHLIQVMTRRAVAQCLGKPSKAPMRHGGAVAF